MQHIKWVLWGSVALSSLVSTGCYASRGAMQRDYVVYHNPGYYGGGYGGAVWSSGYWNWSGNQWLWIDGTWLAPRRGYTYVQPTWVRQGTRWGFRRGYWRPHYAYRSGYVAYRRPVYRQPVGRDRVHVYRNDTPYRGRPYARPSPVPQRARVYRRPYPQSQRMYRSPAPGAPRRVQPGFRTRSRPVYRNETPSGPVYRSPSRPMYRSAPPAFRGRSGGSGTPRGGGFPRR